MPKRLDSTTPPTAAARPSPVRKTWDAIAIAAQLGIHSAREMRSLARALDRVAAASEPADGKPAAAKPNGPRPPRPNEIAKKAQREQERQRANIQSRGRPKRVESRPVDDINRDLAGDDDGGERYADDDCDDSDEDDAAADDDEPACIEPAAPSLALRLAREHLAWLEPHRVKLPPAGPKQQYRSTRGRLDTGRGTSRKPKPYKNNPPELTPQQIAERCAAIRARWTPTEEAKRRLGIDTMADAPREGWNVPFADTSACRSHINPLFD